MKIKNFVLVFTLIALFTSALPATSSAQWSVGASFELRNEEPKSGFGMRVEREILEDAPLFNLGLRAHFSYFSEEKSVTPLGNISYSQKTANYDYGLAALGGISVGPISPYVGLGLGATTLDVEYTDVQNVQQLEGGKESAFLWNGFVGAEVSIVPALKPFVEYRYQDVSEFEEFSSVQKSDGRLIFGVAFSF